MRELSKQSKKSGGIAGPLILSVAFLLLLFFAASEIGVHAGGKGNTQTSWLRVALLCAICLLFYLGGLLYRSRIGNGAMLRTLMVLFFLLYIYLILNFTLFDSSLGRGGDSIYGENKRDYYLRWFVNLRPFRSIYEVYIRGFLKGYVGADNMLLNLLGNIAAFMPFSFFLPLFFKAQKRWFVFLPTMLAVVGAVEALQFCFMIGSCDIDDLILNVGGAMLAFAILSTEKLQKIIEKLTGQSK